MKNQDARSQTGIVPLLPTIQCQCTFKHSKAVSNVGTKKKKRGRKGVRGGKEGGRERERGEISRGGSGLKGDMICIPFPADSLHAAHEYYQQDHTDIAHNLLFKTTSVTFAGGRAPTGA
jgi:hypothetical protein